MLTLVRYHWFSSFICAIIYCEANTIISFSYIGIFDRKNLLKNTARWLFLKFQTFFVCTAALFCGAFLVGCSNPPSLPVLQQIEYSNLADADTQNLLSDLLQNAGVSDLRIQTFFEHVQKFNSAVDPAWLTTGFETAKPLDLKYDPYSIHMDVYTAGRNDLSACTAQDADNLLQLFHLSVFQLGGVQFDLRVRVLRSLSALPGTSSRLFW